MKYSKANIIAEIGCNHKGELDIAMELIRIAKHHKIPLFIALYTRNPHN